MPGLLGDVDARRDAEAVIEMLLTLQRATAGTDLRAASTDGEFPGGLFADPIPVVVDANWFRADVRYACRSQQRTVLVSAANEQFIRAFCAHHVIDEVLEHFEEWADPPDGQVTAEAFIQRFFEEYLPVLRVVPNDGVPDDWLSPGEQDRLARLRAVDPDDIPSVKLAIVLRALYVSKDRPALRAVYGDAAELSSQHEWVDYLKAGGDVGQLRRLLYSASAGVTLVGYGVAAATRRIYSALGGPLTAVAAAGLGWAGFRWLRQPRWAGLKAGGLRVLNVLGVVGALMEQRRRHLEAALPPLPDWDGAGARPALLGRAVLQALARDSRGTRSAHELTETVRSELPCSEPHVRALLRSTTCFQEVYRGRWQVGRALTAESPQGEPAESDEAGRRDDSG
jgi:hypothetical protein